MKKIISIKQYDIADSGVACLATILKYYNKKISISKLRLMLTVDYKGISISNMLKIAEEIGLNAKAVKGSPEALFTDFQLPCIAHVIIDEEITQYVVIHKIYGNKIVITDTRYGILELSINDFLGISHCKYNFRWTGILILFSDCLFHDNKF